MFQSWCRSRIPILLHTASVHLCMYVELGAFPATMGYAYMHALLINMDEGLHDFLGTNFSSKETGPPLIM